MTQSTPLEKAIKQAGSQAILASMIGVTQQAVSLWLKNGKVPAEAAVQIEKSTGIKRKTLRPDIFGKA